MQTPKLTPSLLAALRDCAEFDVYSWKLASMKKLHALELVTPVSQWTIFGHRAGYKITEAGRALLESSR